MKKTLALYIHTPWCIQKCPYCDFNSHKADNNLNQQRYIDALIADFNAAWPMIKGRPIDSIFIGGGTPSLIEAKYYQRLFAAIQAHTPFSAAIEITLEANPGTVDNHRFQDYFDCGINRLSIGVQSFNDAHLKALGRIHDSQTASNAIDAAKKAGFNNFNLDLMHGLPNQTAEQAQSDLKTALSFQPPHLSWYQLTIEPNTVFYKKTPTLPNEQELEQIEMTGLNLLQDYQHYEISAFAKQGNQCRHNLTYWTFGDYLGIGAGAHSKLGHQRFEKKRMPNDYMASPTINIKQRSLDDKARAFEFMLMASRLKMPISKETFEQNTSLPFEQLRPQLEQAKKLKMITESTDSIAVTPHGFRYLNDFQGLFL